MKRVSRGAALLGAVWVLAAGPASAALRVVGSTTVNPVVAEAAEALTRAAGVEIVVDTLGGSSGGIAALGEGRSDLAMSSRPLSDDDRRRFPAADFQAHPIGFDAVALVVSRDVWDGGVRSISREQMRAVYEGKIRNWSALGGPDRRIAFFDKEPGRGTWEVFADWLYGDVRSVPSVSHLEVGANEEVRAKVSSTPGAMSQLSAAWADGERVFALALADAAGAPVAPTSEAFASGRYPMVRPLLLITDGPATGIARRLLDLLRAAEGQALVVRHGYLPLTTGGAAEGR